MQAENMTKQANEEEVKDTVGIFKAIIDNNPIEEKLRQINKYLNQGADINAIDNNNNTLLHIAASRGELEIFMLLLSRGANYNITNDDNATIIDIIEQSETPNGKELSTAFYDKYGYTKRTGTSGVKGELYETKLISLILVRALFETKAFILGTNVKEMGSLDDIVIRYQLSDIQKSKILILQLKHKEKERWSAEYILKLVREYFPSYLQIKQRLLINNNNIIFEDSHEDLDYEIIIYTCAEEYVTIDKNNKTEILVEDSIANSLIKTSANGKVFKFLYEKDYNYFQKLVAIPTESRVIMLAKTLSKFILKHNCDNIMSDDLIKTYHVFLAQNVIQTVESLQDSLLANKKIILGQFRSTFLRSDEANLMFLKNEICKEVAKSIKNNKKDEIESTMESLTFRLPVNFGNSYFHFTGNEIKRQVRLNHICAVFQRLFHNGISKGPYIIVKLDDNSVSTAEVIEKKDLKLCSLGGLVGNLLIYDKETEMLKFNMNEQVVSGDSKIILLQLKSTCDISMYRFDINVYGFPKLALCNRKHDEKLVADFLNKLKIYTNQSHEDDVEIILKGEIDQLLQKRHRKQRDSRISDTIFLKIHDKVQKWWLRSQSAYLTQFHNFYQEAEQESLENFSQLKNINVNYIHKIQNTLLTFETDAILSLGLNRVLDSDRRLMIIYSEEIFFSSVKVYQYFTEIIKKDSYVFINLDSTNIYNYLEILNFELEYTVIPKCVIISIMMDDVTSLSHVISMTKMKKSKFIIIAKNILASKLKLNFDTIYHRDKRNHFSSLSSKVRKTIIEERNIVFQGEDVPVNTVFDDISLELLSANLLHRIINGEKVVLGNTLSDNFYDKAVSYYVDRTLNRYVCLNTSVQNNDLCYVTDVSKIAEVPPDTKDIVLITELEENFKNTCNSNSKSNIHWFTTTKQKHMVWKQSYGSLQNILKYVDRVALEYYDDTFITKPRILEDMQEKIVIITGGSGMGKSTFFTHIAMNTKLRHPKHWIVKINLRNDNISDQLNEWKNKTNIDLIEVVKLLYSEISGQLIDGLDKRILQYVKVDSCDDLYLSVDDDTLFDLDLSEIKLFNYFYNSNNVAVLLDGYDEIWSYTSEAIKLLSTLKMSKLAHLWVSSRPYNGIEQLESTLDCLSYSLNPLNACERINMLNKLWYCKLEPDLQRHCTGFLINEFCSLIEINELELNDYFINSPLNLYMIAEIYQNDLRDFINLNQSVLYNEGIKNIHTPTNLISFYEKFTNKKFDIQFGGKVTPMSSNNSCMKDIKTHIREDFFEIHKKISAAYLLPKELFNDDIQNVDKLIQKVEMVGLVESRIHNKYTFIHDTFAEYFAVEFIFDKLRLGIDDVWKYFMNYVMTSDRYRFRLFVNSKLQSDQHILLMLNSNRKLIHTVYNIVMDQFIKLPHRALYIAINENLEYISIFLIRCIKLVLNKDNLMHFVKLINKSCGIFCVVCLATRKGRQSILDCLKDLIIEIVSDRNNFNKISHLQELFSTSVPNGNICASLNSLAYDRDTIDLTAELQSMCHRDWTSSTFDSAHWTLGKCGFLISFCLNYIKLNKERSNNSLSFSNFDKHLPVHYIDKENDAEFYPAVINLLGQAELNYKYSYIMLRNVLKEAFRKLICEWYTNSDANLENDKNLDVERFVLEDLPKLSPCRNSLLRRLPQNIYYCNDLVNPFVNYQNKLFYLILFRVLCNDAIKDFLFQSGSMYGDIIRYTMDKSEKTKMILVNVMDGHKKDMNFYLAKGLRNYLAVKEKFAIANKYELIFQGPMKNLECKFIIYTAKTNCKKHDKAKFLKGVRKKNLDYSDIENVIITNEDVKPFKFVYDDNDVEFLESSIVKSRADKLARRLLFYINRTKLTIQDMMEDNLIKQYYHFLMTKVIEVDAGNHGKGRFRRDFLKSNEEGIRYMRCTLYSIILQGNKAKDSLNSYTFEWPTQISEDIFSLNGVERQHWIDNTLSLFEKIFQHMCSKDFVYIFDDDSVGPDEIVQREDFVGNNSLAELVGNLLINDNETDMLKFNFNEAILSEYNIEILHMLKKRYDDLSRFRFDIHMYGFPTFSLHSNNHDRKLVRDFLTKLSFYTNQADIDELQKVVRNEIHTNINIQQKHRDVRFRVKCDEIFLTNLKHFNQFGPSFTHNIFSTYLKSYKVPIPDKE